VFENVIFYLDLWSYKKNIILKDIVYSNKVVSFLFKVFYYDPMVKTSVFKNSKLELGLFLRVFCVSKCHLSHRIWIVISKLVYFEISLIVTKLSFSCFKCSTIDAWQKLSFQNFSTSEFALSWLYLVYQNVVFYQDWEPS